MFFFFFFSSRRRHTRSTRDWSSDVCSSDLIGARAADRRLSGKRLGPGLWLAHRVAELVALRPVRNQLGLSKLRRAYTGGAPLGPDVFRFFHSIGVNLKQIYGQTEICG